MRLVLGLLLVVSLHGQTTVAGGYTFTGPIATMTGLASAKPATCTVGQIYFATDATAGANLYLCTASNTWTQLSGGTNQASIYASGGYQRLVECVNTDI